MAVGKVARRTVVADVAALLDSPELAELIGELEPSVGRKGYGARTLIGACLVKSLYALPTWTFVAALIAEHPAMQEAIGGCPSVWAMYRFGNKLRANRPALSACLDAFAASLRKQHPDFGRDVAIDASDIPAWGNGHRYVYEGGPQVAKVTPYWTSEAETPAVYHNQSDCSEGKKILPENKETGTPPSDRRLCEVCADLA